MIDLLFPAVDSPARPRVCRTDERYRCTVVMVYSHCGYNSIPYFRLPCRFGRKYVYLRMSPHTRTYLCCRACVPYFMAADAYREHCGWSGPLAIVDIMTIAIRIHDAAAIHTMAAWDSLSEVRQASRQGRYMMSNTAFSSTGLR